ncbi:alpha/beta fold hydrolase [Parapedobacter lycopersici]|uniref:alpha/beta fold hydrolase n=1 Tax=Parapedobacter lycopersici TaxID=1864939 RepID=UPI00214D2707|nr:alpha/beta hydrolase [Parapedobacter lycopersici]
MKRFFFCILGLVILSISAHGQQREVLDIDLSNYNYPYEVHLLALENQQQSLQMAYMDVHPEQPNGETVMLFHGKNFNGAYWGTTIDALTRAGYRVVVPDQIGFGKSTKPAHYQYSFQQLAQNTMKLLETLNISQVYLLGHSMGGMLAMRFTLMYPEVVKKLVLENPIGLEDWKLVAPYTAIDQLYQKELNADFNSVKKYQLDNYYDGKWRPEYDEWVYLLTGWVDHPDYPLVAWNNALTSDMIFTQPVYYEMEQLKAPTLLIIGTRDRTAIGKQQVSETVRATMGLYQHLGKAAQQRITGSSLVELENVGHMPHIEAFGRFIEPLLRFLKD